MTREEAEALVAEARRTGSARSSGAVAGPIVVNGRMVGHFNEILSAARERAGDRPPDTSRGGTQAEPSEGAG